MGEQNRFRALKDPEQKRFTQIKNVKMYKKAPEDTMEEGLCAATAMRWLATQKVPTTDEDLKELNELQKAYDKEVEETRKPGNALEKILAPKYNRTISSWRLPLGPVNEAIEYWHKWGGFADGLTRYLSGELTNGTPKLPCYIWVNFTGTINDLSVDDARKLPEFEEVPDPRGGHAMALLQTPDGGPYHFFDPNVGVYEVLPAIAILKAFFETLQKCYKSPDKLGPGWNEGHPEVPLTVERDVELVRIYHVLK